MNKQITLDQLELASGSSSEESFLARVPQAALAAPSDAEDFNWNDDDSIILKEQRATAAYRNRDGELIIRQRARWNDNEDTFVFISPENEVAFLEGLAKRARES